MSKETLNHYILSEESTCCGADRYGETDICNECREHSDFN